MFESLFNILSSAPGLQLIITFSLLVNVCSPLLCYSVIFLLQIYLPEIGYEHEDKNFSFIY